MLKRPACTLVLFSALLASGLAAGPAVAQDKQAQTFPLVPALDGGSPNAPSEHPVISSDRRYARLIAFESDASNIAANDTNGLRDVFVLVRGGSVGNDGAPWEVGQTVLLSQGIDGPANGPSSRPAVSGDFDKQAKCVAFISSASNLVGGDDNGVADAFVSRNLSTLRRLEGGSGDVTDVAVSGDCKAVAWLREGQVFVEERGKVKQLSASGVTDLSFAVGRSRALVLSNPEGVFLAKKTYNPRLVVPGASQGVFNNLKRQTLAYTAPVDGVNQVFSQDLGQEARIASGPGNAPSHSPSIGNSGFYVAFESEASNLGVGPSGEGGDSNGIPDAYLYTQTRNITLGLSVDEGRKVLPGGGRQPSMSFYANYTVFVSQTATGPQVFMRYLGPV